MDPHRISALEKSVQESGYAVVEGILSPDEVEMARAKMYSARDQIVSEIGRDRLLAAKEYGVLRCMMKFEPFFLSLLENRKMLTIVDALLSDTAILHLQNGFILESFPADETPSHFQNSYHRDFPRYLNGYRASINILIAIDGFNRANGGTHLVPHTHQQGKAPSPDYLKENDMVVECGPGAAIVFDSTLWHASGINSSGRDRLGINHQFTRSFLKQQIDYVRLLGEERVRALPARSQQLLGYYSRVPTSLDEYYKPEGERLYRKGQG